MPANFAQIFEENFQQGLGERNSNHGKFNEISSDVMGMENPPFYQMDAHFPIQGVSHPQQQSGVGTRIPPPIPEEPAGVIPENLGGQQFLNVQVKLN